MRLSESAGGHRRVRANREGAHALDLDGRRGEPEALDRQGSESRQVLADRDPGGEQDRVDRPGAPGRVVDVE
jgi:hypothetical protein